METDAYVTGAGEYPVAPNTSVDAFLAANPQYDTKRYRTLLLQDSPKWVTDNDDWSLLRSKYDSWSLGLQNSYLADVERWKTRYQSPLNGSELLEAAGYNRNWIQGASGSMPDTQPVQPAFSDAGVNDFDNAGNIVNSLHAFSQMLGQAASISDTLASRDLKLAQTEAIRDKLPFQLSEKYFPILEKLKEHGYINPGQDVLHFEPGTPGKGIDVFTGSSDNYFDNMLGLQRDVMALRKGSMQLNKKQQEWIQDTMNPINQKISELQRDLLQGTKTLQDYNIELEGIIQPLKKEYIPKGMKQQYWLTYVTAAANLAAQVGGLIAKFKGLSLGQDVFDWRKQMDMFSGTGEMPTIPY